MLSCAFDMVNVPGRHVACAHHYCELTVSRCVGDCGMGTVTRGPHERVHTMRRAISVHWGVLAVATLLLGGCATNGQSGGARHAYDQGMSCPTCETVWVQRPGSSGSGSRVQAIQWGRQMVCPECDAMAEAYFRDGEQALHDCPTCKVTPRPTTSRPLRPTHPRGTHS